MASALLIAKVQHFQPSSSAYIVAFNDLIGNICDHYSFICGSDSVQSSCWRVDHALAVRLERADAQKEETKL